MPDVPPVRRPRDALPAFPPTVLLLLFLFGTPAAAEPIYLALGDSSGFGETNRTRNPSNGDRGYVSPFADYLAGVYGTRPTVMART